MPPVDGAELLTADEQRLVTLLAQVSTLFRLIGGGETTELNEVMTTIHVLQNTVLAQAAARAYPDQYRLLGYQRLAGTPRTGPLNQNRLDNNHPVR